MEAEELKPNDLVGVNKDSLCGFPLASNRVTIKNPGKRVDQAGFDDSEWLLCVA